MSACLLLSAGPGVSVIYGTTQNGTELTKTRYLKTFQVEYTVLAQTSFGAVYNQFIQASSVFELDQTAINPTL